MKVKTAVLLAMFVLMATGAWAGSETVIWNFGGTSTDGTLPSFKRRRSLSRDDESDNSFCRGILRQKLLWQKAAGNAGEWNDNNTLISPAVSVDSAGKVFVTGGYEGTASFGGINLESPGPSSIFLAELAPDSD